MWALDNRTPFGAERNWLRDRRGMHWWLVAVQATFAISADGRLRLADEQTPPPLSPEYEGKPGLSSLRRDSDLLEIKPRTDLLVVGSAYAPGGQPAPQVPVRVRTVGVDKRLFVYGDRLYRLGPGGLAPSGARAFVTRPIRYEIAFGGSDLSSEDPRRHRIDERNPIGRGFSVAPERLVDTLAHCVELADGAGGNPPAGLGPVDRSWLPRRRLAGTYDAAWAQSKAPLLPDDYDAAFGLSSPTDQQADLRGGERVEFLNLTPSGVLRVELPSVQLSLSSAFGRRKQAHDGALLATVLFEPDEGRVSMVWQSAIQVAAPEADYLDLTTITHTGSLTS